MNLNEGFTKILKEYPFIRDYTNIKKKKEKNLVNPELEDKKTEYIEFLNIFKKYMQELVSENMGMPYNIKCSTLTWGADVVQYIAITNPDTPSINENFYPVYLFKSEGQGVYLCLGIGVNQFKKTKSVSFNKKTLKTIKKVAREFRNHVKNINDNDSESNFDFSKFSEVCDLESDKDLAKAYGAGSIYCKYYELNDNKKIFLPSENELVEDLNEFIRLYQYFSNYNDYFNELINNEVSTVKPGERNNEMFYDSFYDYLRGNEYYFDMETIENFLLSLKVKPFIILTGNSGTGKTKLALLFAQYLQEKLNYEYNYELVAVGANWTDNRNIIGYHNVIIDDYQDTPTYNLILEASKKQDKPYFLILDEMNLSYVERYFADFLSAIESGEKMEKPGTNEKLYLPENLFVIGTVNIDETTYMFSPKVLDRANVLEFKTIPITRYMDNTFEKLDLKENKNITYLENPLIHDSFISEDNQDRIKINDLRKKYDEEIWDELKTHLTNLHEKLQVSGFDFGFRVTNEILSFVLEAKIYENDENYDWKRYFDTQILQKLLPKLHGSRNVIGNTLQELEEYCRENKFEKSCKKLHEMNEELETLRYVSFIK